MSVSVVCRQFGKRRQSYYAQLQRSRQRTEHTRVLEEEVLAFVRSVRTRQPKIGARKLLLLLEQQTSLVIGRDHFLRLLRQQDLLVARRSYRPQTTNSRHWMRKYPNLILGLRPSGPNQLWVADITYLLLQPSYRYLAVITDAYSHKIVGWAVASSLDTTGPLRALRQALRQRAMSQQAGSTQAMSTQAMSTQSMSTQAGVKNESSEPLPPLIHHSDRGVQYCSAAYTELLRSHGIAISMTTNGDPYQNAIAERINGILKYEFGLGAHFSSDEEIRRTLRQAIALYNTERPHASCQYLTPQQAHRTRGPLKQYWSKKKYQPVNTF